MTGQVVEFFEIVLPRCANTYGVLPCSARIETEDDPVAAAFDGSTTYLRRVGGLTGAADSKSFTFSTWIRPGAVGLRYVLTGVTTLAGGTGRVAVRYDADQRFTFLALNSAGSAILNQKSRPVSLGNWVHVLASFDLSNPARCFICIDDVPLIDVATTFTNDTIDFTLADWSVGALADSDQKLIASLGDLWFAPGVYLDLSVEANRRKFVTADINPVDLGATGNLPTGTAPLVFLSGDLATWHTNDGTGGGFTLTGTLGEDEFGTGAAKCFNCLATCQDTNNFDETTATIRFAKPASYLPRDIDIVGPWIKSIDHTSATISLAENLGTRAVLKVTLEDHRHSDAGEGLDSYHADRGYNPYERGSFWPRFVARYPSLDGVECAWIIGEVGQSIEEMERRTFFIEGAPSGDGTVTITAKDALKFLDGAKAQVPVLSEGFLTAGINSSATSFTISPSGAGADYPSPGHIRIAGKEDCSFTRSGDVFTIARGALGTTAASHSAGDRVQLIKRYAAVAAADIIANAIGDYSDLPADYIPLAEWQLDDSTNLGTLYTFTLGEPTSVASFVSRVLEQCGGMMWDDALAKKLRFRVIKSVSPAAAVVSEANVINKTFELIAQPEQRVSQTYVYYGISDPTKRRDDLANYKQSVKLPDQATIDASELLYGSRSLRTILADGIAVGGGTVASRVGNLVVGRKQRPPRRFKWSMLRTEPNLPVLGGGYYLDWRSLQDASGAREQVPVQVISAKTSATIVQFTAEEMRFTDLDTGSSTDRVILINFDTYNINLRDIHDLTYPSTFGGGVTVTFIISATVGSTSTGTPAVHVGDWSDAGGLEPTLIITATGRVQGKGGQGGGLFTAGYPGGVALYARYPFDLEFPSGAKIAGGGGGGAGSNAGQGGGGAGQQPGLGANPGTLDTGGAPDFLTGVQVGGYGGSPGVAGQALGIIAGGAAGAAIDGDSYVTRTVTGGSVIGPQVN